MRKSAAFSRIFCAFGALALLAAGCNTEEQETREIDFSLSRYSVVFAVGGGITSITVGTSDSWSASTDATWLSLSQDASTLYITAEANDETTEIRQTEVIVTADSYGSETIQVRQEPGEAAQLSVNYGSADCTIDSEGGSFTVSVTSNAEWTAALAEAVDGWDLSADPAASTVTVTAGQNLGSALTGTIVVSASKGGETLTEEVSLTQGSHADNVYFKYPGYWNVNSTDCIYLGEHLGEGVNNSCTIAEYSYPDRRLSLIDWGKITSGTQQNDELEYHEDGTVVIPAAHVYGTVSAYYGSLRYTFYTYLVTLKYNEPADEDSTGSFSFNTSYNPVLTVSEDGSKIEVSGVSDEYPYIGFVGYNGYVGYISISNTTYCKVPMTFERTDSEGGASLRSVSSFRPVSLSELPEGIPQRLPEGLTGTAPLWTAE